VKAGIIAAGHGRRFLEAGWKQPKPLIPLCGKPLIDYTLENLFSAGVDEIGILLNAEPATDVVERHLAQSSYASRLTVWRKTTGSSFESFLFVYRRLGEPPFAISTVDTVHDLSGLEDFLNLSQYRADGRLVLALTEFVNDPRPLWAEMDGQGVIKRLGDDVSQRQYVTAGIYLVLQPLNLAEAHAFPALREYLRHTVSNGHRVLGKRVDTAIDVDCPEDVQIAESFLGKRRK